MDTWNHQCLQALKLFAPLLPFEQLFSHYTTWPSLDDYNLWFPNSIVEFIEQLPRNVPFSQQYNSKIFLQHQVQTRTESWHDFFNMLIWQLFPLSKLQISTGHYHDSLSRYKNQIKTRTSYENILTHFDECGVIVVSSDNNYLELLQNHQWQQLFWQQRDNLFAKIKFIIFGHATYEVALTRPFIGLTAKALLLQVPEKWLQLDRQELSEKLDVKIAKLLADKNILTYPKILQPIPILGIPGWHFADQNKDFYSNTDYFRRLPLAMEGLAHIFPF